MKPKVSIIEELDRHVSTKNPHAIIESRAVHLIASMANLCEQIARIYPKDQAEDLIRRLQRAVLSNDERKFTRKIAEHKNKKDQT